MNALRFVFILVVGLPLTEVVTAATLPDIALVAPRNFGHVVGEIIHHDIHVRLSSDYSLESSLLPSVGSAVNDWLEVRQLSWDGRQEGPRQVYHIAIDYQVFKGVRETEVVVIPSWPLHFRKAGDSVVREVPAWAFTLNPLISPKLGDEDVPIRDDLPVPDLPWQSRAGGFFLALILLFCSYLFAAWRRSWLPFRAKRMLPFDQACRQLRCLQRRPLTPERLADEFRVVHTALNATFGVTVFPGQLARRVADQPRWTPLRDTLEQFFRYSERLFFAHQTALPEEELRLWLAQFCRQCRQVEGHRP